MQLLMSWISSVQKEFALTKIEESDIKDDSGKEPIADDDADPEDLEVFYPTHQWQTLRPGNVLLPNYSVPPKPHPAPPAEALQKTKNTCLFPWQCILLLLLRQGGTDPMTRYREKPLSPNPPATGVAAKVPSVHQGRSSGLPVKL